ncbi:hypothetical protein [Peterkaempfera griseoplana]|uniref:hypothetical protein n=1 Tax=Peterkaempfera griseoplana TaxID=66896 RepID=UPI0006E30F41|nr:hypothetical protein [Peterkaempfera griseoplana]
MPDKAPRSRQSTVDGIINRYLDHMPGASGAYLQDPAYHRDVVFLRRALALADLAMEDQGVPAESRARVIRTVVCGSPNEDEANARIEQHLADVKRATQGPLHPQDFGLRP